MGRPLKIGYDSFPHDTNAAADEKMTAFRTLHGNDAYAFYFILCENIYRTAATLDMEDPDTVNRLAQSIMVTAERFYELLDCALELGLFSILDYSKGVLSNDQYKRCADRSEVKRQRWRRTQNSSYQRGEKVISADNSIIIADNEQKQEIPTASREDELSSRITENEELSARITPFEPVSSIGLKKDLSSKDLSSKDLIPTHLNAHAREAPPPFENEGKLDVLKAMNHYGITVNGFLKLEMICAYQGIMDDELILAAIKESGGRTASYCAKVVESWNAKGWRKLSDHPSYQPTKGGEVVEIARGRVERQRSYPRTATQIAFEEAGKRSRPGRQVWTPRE